MTVTRLRAAAGRVTEWLLAWGNHPSGPVVLILLTLLEATVFPAPTEAMLLALSISRPRRAWWFATLAATGSVVGGIIGYQLGATVFPQFGRPVLDALGFSAQLPLVERAYRDNMWLALITSGYTPIPYLLYTMMAGAFSLPIIPFVAGSLIGRALKYIPLALLAWWLGPAVRQLVSRYAAWVGAGVTLLLAAAIVWTIL